MSTNLTCSPGERPTCTSAPSAGPGKVRPGIRDAVFPADCDGSRGHYRNGVSRPVSHPAALPVPPELRGLPPRPRVLQLTDGDCVSHGLAEGTGRQRASDREVRSCLDQVHATAVLLDPHARTRCAVSTESAARHLDVLTTSGNNLFAIRRGLDGADWALLEELTDLIDARTAVTRPARKRPTPLTDLVILVGKDRIYAPAVRQLLLLGIPTWLIVPGRRPAASLYRAACAVSFVGPYQRVAQPGAAGVGLRSPGSPRGWPRRAPALGGSLAAQV